MNNMSFLEIVITVLIALSVFFALRRIVRMRKSGCSCGCSGCSGCCAACGGGCETARKKEPRSKSKP